MRSHKQIVQDRGASKLVRELGELGIQVHQSTPQRWAERDSIPGEYWKPLVDLGAASLDELADAASRKSQGAAA